MSNRKLFAGPFVGEFGHELFCWQGKIRKLSKDYKHTTVVCLPGHQILYSDFADEIIEYSPESYIPDCSWNRGVTDNYPTPDEDGYDYIGPNKQIIRLYDEHQDFVKLGKKIPNMDYDFIFSARYTDKLNSSYRNWPTDNWDNLAERLLNDGYRIGCIGLSTMSYKVQNTDDFLDLDLESLANVLSSSKKIIGPSSGPIHFATLCKTEQLLWSGDDIEKNKIRYLDWWNPFDVKVEFIPNPDWNPSVDEIYERCIK